MEPWVLIKALVDGDIRRILLLQGVCWLIFLTLSWELLVYFAKRALLGEIFRQ